MTFSWEALVILVLIFLPSFFYLIFKPRNRPLKIDSYGTPVVIAEHLMRLVVIFLLLFLSKEPLDMPLWIINVGFMVVCLVIYWILWVNYFSSEREYAYLAKMAMPMALLPTLYLLVGAWFLQNIPALIAAAVFAVLHLLNAYKMNKQLYNDNDKKDDDEE